MAAVATRLFTVSQWQELEQQALIFKYLMAGIPVPLNLILPIQKSFESASSRIFQHPNMYGGKKVDPEPDRCRRSDGKKWRCSKDAFPDSKYCEHHMNRGRNRSRKPVESSLLSSSSPSSSSHNIIASSSSHPSGNYDHHSSFRSNIPLLSFANNSQETAGTHHHLSHFNSDPISTYGNIHKDYRNKNIDGGEIGEHRFLGMEKGDEMGLGLENSAPWSMNPIFKASKQEESYEGQLLRPFFDELPGTRDPWCGLEEEDGSFSRTRLSMSIPMASSSNFSINHDN